MAWWRQVTDQCSRCTKKKMLLPLLVVGWFWLIGGVVDLVGWLVTWKDCKSFFLPKAYDGVLTVQKVRFGVVHWLPFVEKWRLGTGQCSSICTWWAPVALAMSIEFETQSKPNWLNSVLNLMARTRPIIVVTLISVCMYPLCIAAHFKYLIINQNMFNNHRNCTCLYYSL